MLIFWVFWWFGTSWDVPWPALRSECGLRTARCLSLLRRRQSLLLLSWLLLPGSPACTGLWPWLWPSWRRPWRPVELPGGRSGRRCCRGPHRWAPRRLRPGCWHPGVRRPVVPWREQSWLRDGHRCLARSVLRQQLGYCHCRCYCCPLFYYFGHRPHDCCRGGCRYLHLSRVGQSYGWRVGQQCWRWQSWVPELVPGHYRCWCWYCFLGLW